MNNRSRPTIREVAIRAGVSHQTVSRVINNSERVNPETRLRVEAAIAELGYQPNAIARSMARGRTHTLACISPNLTDFTFASIIEGAEQEALQHDYFLLTASAPDPKRYTYLIDQLLASRRTDGMLVITPFINSYHIQLPKNIPAVFVGANASDKGFDSVTLDDECAGYNATRHLIELGHERIALIAGPIAEDCTRNRLAGYQRAFSSAGINPDPELIFVGDWSATSGYQAVLHFLSREAHFTAIFAQNDRMAIGAIRALQDSGRRVPQDISVIGFDDMPLASYFDPALTSMRQDFLLIGSEAAHLLIRRVEQPHKPVEYIHPMAELVRRSTTSRR